MFIKKNNLILTIIFIVVVLLGSCKKDSENSSGYYSSIIYSSFNVDSIKLKNDTIYYDINKDLKNDIKLTNNFIIKGDRTQFDEKIVGIDNNIKFCCRKTNNSWDLLELNDRIDSSRSYEWPDIDYEGSFSKKNPFLLVGYADYYGFQIVINKQKYYGWLHLKSFGICEIGFNQITNAFINVGQKY